MKKTPKRYDLTGFKCNKCNKPDSEISGIMKSHKYGRWVSYDDYKKLDEEIENLVSELKYKEQKFNDLIRKTIMSVAKNKYKIVKTNGKIGIKFTDDTIF